MYNPETIKKVNSKLHSFQASLRTLTAIHLTLIHVAQSIRGQPGTPFYS